MEIFSYQRALPTAFLRLNGYRRLKLMFRSGKVRLMVESRILCARLAVVLIESPMFGNCFDQLTDDVRVDWVRVCGLYILFKLLRS